MLEINTSLNGMFSYSIIPIAFIFLLLVLSFLYFNWCKTNKNIYYSNNLIDVSNDNDDVKNRYLEQIDVILNEFKSNNINNRQVYYKLSILIRQFVFEMTNINVNCYTLTDIEKLNIPVLYDLLCEFYIQEFSKVSNGDVLLSIKKTKDVIAGWN